MGEFDGVDRRITPCPRHDDVVRNFERGDERMNRFEAKIDDLLDGQAQQALSIQALKDTVGNGLTGEIRRTREGVDELSLKIKVICNNYDTKIAEHEAQLTEFRWFRDWANRFRDGLIRRVLTMAFYGGTIIGIIYLYEKYVKNVANIIK
jgi:hypothetical protein